MTAESKSLSYIRTTLKNAREQGAPIAVHEALKDANVAVNFDKRTLETLINSGKGILFIGDHKKGLEPVFLLGALGELGKKNIHFIGMPYVFPERKVKRFGLADLKLVLPIIPGYAIRRPGRKKSGKHIPLLNKLIARAGTRWAYGRSLSDEERVAINESSINETSKFLDRGHYAGIFPTGKRDINSQWFDGVAKILLGTSVDQRENILVEPFSCGVEFSRMELSRAVTRRAFGRKPKEQRTFNITFGTQPKTVFELIGNETNPEKIEKITETLKRYYLDSMRPKTRRRRSH